MWHRAVLMRTLAIRKVWRSPKVVMLREVGVREGEVFVEVVEVMVER